MFRRQTINRVKSVKRLKVLTYFDILCTMKLINTAAEFALIRSTEEATSIWRYSEAMCSFDM